MHYIPDNTEFLENLSTVKQPESKINYWPIIIIVVGFAVGAYLHYRRPPMFYTNWEDQTT